MSNMVTGKSAPIAKFRIASAVLAITAAATLTPAVVAEAQPVSQLSPIAQGLGDSIDSAVLDDAVTTDPVVALFGPLSGYLQNQYWWVGEPNDDPLDPVELGTVSLLGLVPDFLKPLYLQLTQGLNFEACFAGATVKFGPYGSASFSASRGC